VQMASQESQVQRVPKAIKDRQASQERQDLKGVQVSLVQLVHKARQA